VVVRVGFVSAISRRSSASAWLRVRPSREPSTRIATDSGADVEQMQASASSYMDGLYRDNQLILEKASENVKYAVIALGIEIVALTAAIPVSLLT
jgi:hypothetical protein